MLKNQKAIGIIGGMGPFASSRMYEVLLRMSRDKFGALADDDFPEILIDSVSVPDFISNTENMALAKKALISRVRKMNRFGVGSIGIACNTAHLLYDDLSKESVVKFTSILELVARDAQKRRFRRIGILATPTTIKFNLYGKVMDKLGIKVIYPTKRFQRLLETIIRLAISGKKDAKLLIDLEKETNNFVDRERLDGFVLGCTELPLVFPKNKFKGKVIDSIEVLAEELLMKYYK